MKEFEKHGFTTKNVSNEHYRLRAIFDRYGLEPVLYQAGSSQLMAWAVGTFASAEILTIKKSG